MKKLTLTLLVVVFYHTSFSQILTENFNDITSLSGAGWSFLNLSSQPGTTNWFQGIGNIFPAYAGANSSYIAANFQNHANNGTISNWMILPVTTVNNGDQINFFTRGPVGSNYPDRLQVRMSIDGGSSTNPTNSSDLGSYTTLLLDINPTLAIGGYPEAWTEQLINISGLASTTDVRIAFRYFANDAGPNGANSNYIGIDEIEVSSPPLSVNDIRLSNVTHYYDKQQSSLNLESKNYLLSGAKIYSLTGQEVLSKKLSGYTERINLNAISQGLYVVKIEVIGGTKLIKLVKE
ncbi:choice-of-anchor J domain-containing protein [Pontimicrobium sp. SW4]|uniref:Choice-of-anchor J domain-containing protein n=1 Tax=Pontimicrobium sp. SW4 TaxID=3153519 RepID=A0AAU7BRI6_9FLAO